jgi:protein ImuB
LLLAAQGTDTLIEGLPALRAAVAALPLGTLELGERWSRDLWGMGLRRIGDLLRLPRSGLAERLGPVPVRRLARILGEEPDPRLPFRPPPRFTSRLELPAEVVAAEALGFAGRRLLLELGGYLVGRGGGVQRLEWRLRHPRLPATRFTLGLARPERDPQRLQELLRERLSRLVLVEPVREIALLARDIQPMPPQPWGLFPEQTHAQQETAQRFLDRLVARLGREVVRGLGLVPDHRPERAWTYAEPGSGAGGRGRFLRPLWLLPTPAPLEDREGWPYHQGRLELEGERERIETGWWDGEAVARDYFVAITPQGERLWIFRERQGERRWFLHGLFG